MKLTTAIITVILFGAFGYIGAAQKENEWLLVAAAAGLGLVIVFLLQQLLGWSSGNNTAAAGALEQGVLFMIPFAVLAVLADVWLGWHSAQAFFSAGLSTMAISSGAVIIKQGGHKFGSIIFPLVLAFAGSVAWMLIAAKV